MFADDELEGKPHKQHFTSEEDTVFTVFLSMREENKKEENEMKNQVTF
jgi:hypothetical protein